jgi:hypothetical protein
MGRHHRGADPHATPTVEEDPMNTKLVVIICAAGTAACSSTASIRRHNGMQEEATVVGRTRAVLVVQNGEIERRIPNHTVAEIDHPGNVHALVGTLLLAYGVLNIAAGTPRCEQEGPAFCVGVFAPAAVGASMAVWGLTVWSRSRRAAADPEANRGPELSLAPWVSRTGPGYQGGGAFRLSY